MSDLRPQATHKDIALYSRPTIDEMVADGRFPKPFWMSERRKAWLESEVDEWLTERAEAREKK